MAQSGSATRMRPPLRSVPPTSPSPYRHLGRGGGERPVRVQVILALIAALVLVAVPLYLWRRPQPASIPSAEAASGPASPVMPAPISSALGAMGDPNQLVGESSSKVVVAPIKTLKCQSPGPGKTPPERCDGLRFFEDSLARAIRDSSSCMPSTKSGFVASFILEANFAKKRTNLYFGKSTTLSKGRRKELLRCVEKSLATPDWDRIPHQHQKYSLNAVATYPGAEEATSNERVEPLAPKATSKPKTSPKSPAPKSPAGAKKAPAKAPTKSE